jgi:hypothetical protein
VKSAALASEPGPGGTCRVCGSKLAEGSLLCKHCGAAYGEGNRCPHCGSVADVEKAGTLGYRCRVCGGARVPVDDARVVRSGREIPLLKRAQRERLKLAGFRVGAALVGGFGVFSLLVVLLVLAIATPGIPAALLATLATAVPLIFAAALWRRSRAQASALGETIEQAWTLVASDVLDSVGEEVRAEALAKTLRTEPAHAESLLARLNAHDFVHARVTDEGELVYSTRAPERLRIGDGMTELAEAEESAAPAAVPTEPAKGREIP